MKRLTMADTHPGILRWLGARHPVLSMPAALILAGIMLSLATNSGSSPAAKTALLLLGIAYWTFLEYAIHRWVYHKRFKGRAAWFLETFHLHHHRNLEDERVLNAGPLLVFPLAAAVLLPFYLITGFSLSLTAEFGIGTLSAYTFYEWVHYLIHKGTPKNTGYIAWMRRMHMHHHEHSWARNFGNTSPIWDLVFGTYAPVDAKEPGRISLSERIGPARASRRT